MKLILKILFTLYAFVCLYCSANAQQDSLSNPIQISGNGDVYYRYGLNKNPSITSPSFAHNRIGLGWLNIVTKGDFKHWGFAADLAAGERTVQLYSSEGEAYSFITQAYVHYGITEKLRASFGAFTTHFNREHTVPGENGNYSNTLIYTIIPAAYTGLKFDYQLSDKWSFMLGVFADSDRKIEETKGKHIGWLANYIGDKLNNTVDFITGKDGDTTHIFMLDDFGDYKLTNRFLLGWEVHYMLDNDDRYGKSQWYGIALYAQQYLARRFSLNFRTEWLSDPDGYGFGQPGNHFFANTLTGKFELASVTLMPEIRMDNASKAVFEKKYGTTGNQEVSFLLAAMVKL